MGGDVIHGGTFGYFKQPPVGLWMNPARFPAEAVFLTSKALPLLVLRLRLSLTSPDRILTAVVKWHRNVQPSLES